MDGRLWFNGILRTQVAAISCLRVYSLLERPERQEEEAQCIWAASSAGYHSGHVVDSTGSYTDYRAVGVWSRAWRHQQERTDAVCSAGTES